jgi:NAD(P)-dependent dehydrogenase (short-subunit alcohol dehydrogenase family)
MLERSYSGMRAYCQSKLAQIMFTIDLAEELAGSGVTANALHPATYMPTKIVATPTSSLDEGVQATLRLVAEPALDGITGRYFDRTREGRADPQAYDPAARRRLRELSERLAGIQAHDRRLPSLQCNLSIDCVRDSSRSVPTVGRRRSTTLGSLSCSRTRCQELVDRADR